MMPWFLQTERTCDRAFGGCGRSFTVPKTVSGRVAWYARSCMDCVAKKMARPILPGRVAQDDLMPRAVRDEEFVEWGRSMGGGDTSHMVDA